MAQVSLKQVSKRFGTVSAISDLSLDIRDREFFVLLGPTGASKSTTLRCIAGLEQPEAGEVCIAEQRVNEWSAAQRDVALVFVAFCLFDSTRQWFKNWIASLVTLVVFQLIIFFMAVSQMSEVERERLQLPKQTGAEFQEPKTLAVNVTETGEFRIAGQTVSMSRLVTLVSNELKRVGDDPNSLIIVVRGDERGDK
jgi:ABC-type polar amino acid transport system ATPase subunit